MKKSLSVAELPRTPVQRVQVVECGRCHKRKLLTQKQVVPNLSIGDEVKTMSHCGAPMKIVVPRVVEAGGLKGDDKPFKAKPGSAKPRKR